MKKITLFILIMLLMAVSTAFAKDLIGPDAAPITLMSAQMITGTATEHQLTRSANQFSCEATWGGTVPTSITFWVQLADTTTVYDSASGDAEVTMTASPKRFYLIYKAGKFIRANYISKVGGDGTTSLTVKCVPVWP